MPIVAHSRTRVVAPIALLICLGLAGLEWNQWRVAAAPRNLESTASLSSITPVDLLTTPVNASAANAAQIDRGRYLVAAGDCMSCHLREGGEPFAGGLGLETPFGVIYSSNITSDPEMGIGAWSSEQFYRAMHDGEGRHGEHLYPAFPYPWFRLATRADDDAIFAFLLTTPAVRYSPPVTKLPFPLNYRWTLGVWNLLYVRQEFKSDPQHSSEWNRGAYLVNGLGHCGGCHTPKKVTGADKQDRDFFGGSVDNWAAPDLTGNALAGLGSWTSADVTEYLRTGRNARASAGEAMADVVKYSTSLLNDADLQAMAVYLKSLRPSDTGPADTPDPGAMSRGAAVYSDACTACHLEKGVGQPQTFPPLIRNAMVQQHNPTGLIHVILGGTRVAATLARPSPLAMPSFAWKLSDQEIADVATFVRHSWGNQASSVSAKDVGKLRDELNLQVSHLTVNSGDHE
jgi:mono/diheme cytochrome c family protein